MVLKEFVLGFKHAGRELTFLRKVGEEYDPGRLAGNPLRMRQFDYFAATYSNGGFTFRSGYYFFYILHPVDAFTSLRTLTSIVNKDSLE